MSLHPNNTVFPTPVPIVTPEGGVSFCENFGLNVRQHMAIEFMSAMLGRDDIDLTKAFEEENPRVASIAKMAVISADALIAQLNKTL